MAGGVIERAGAGGRKVRIYGEMVALLWDAGDVPSAIALEDLWNDLGGEREFTLLCAYPMASFQHTSSGTHFRRICDQHSTVIPSEVYALLGGADAQQRAVALLQQQTAALKVDVARLRADQIVAELEYVERLADRSQRKVIRRTSASKHSRPRKRWRPPRGSTTHRGAACSPNPCTRCPAASVTPIEGRLLD